jgi:nucleoside-diphosphate-sugar epimerase
MGMTRTAIVTGTSSFVGTHLARAFADAGYTVTATHSRPLETYNGVRAERLSFAAEKARLAKLDITDASAIGELANRIRPDLWVHHAGHTTDYASADYDAATGDAVNVAPLDAVFDAIKSTGGGVLVTGSSAEYGNSEQANREDEHARPETPYGISKLAETNRAATLSRSTGVPVRVGRLYIPFGHLDHPAKLLAQVMAGLRSGTPIDLSSCRQRRDFIGVGDVCSAWIDMADDLTRGGFDVINVCSGQAIELRALLLAIADTMNADASLLRFGARPMRAGEAPVSFGDNEKARRLLNWIPRPLELALKTDLLRKPDQVSSSA